MNASDDVPGSHSIDIESDGDSRQAAFEVYRAIRAHEVMLNEASNTYEHGVVAPLILINGGAVVAYLTLLGARSSKSQGLTVPIGWVVAAVSCWGFGLVAAQIMITLGLAEQRAWSERHLIKRRQLERHLLGTDHALSTVLYPDLQDVALDASRREGLRKAATSARSRITLARAASLIFFVAGIACAAASLA